MSETKKVGFFKKIANFFRDVKSEVSKITWPTLKQVRNNTGIVIVSVIIVAIIIALLDLAFQGIWMLLS